MQRVIVNDDNSDLIQFHPEVTQSTVLGPLLSNLYVNNLELKTFENLQHATVLLTSDCDIDICKNSNEHSIEVILGYVTSLALKSKADKTEFFVFGKQNQQQSPQIRKQKIEEKSHVKFLGVTIDNEQSYLML